MSTFITKLAKENGLKIVEAKKPMMLEVFPLDVRRAKAKNSKCCAVARAAQRLEGVKAAYVFRTTAYLEYDERLVRYVLPMSVQKEIVSFDRAKLFEPGVYQLSAPKKSATTAAIQARSLKRPGRHQPGDGKIQRKVKHHTRNIRTLDEPLA